VGGGAGGSVAGLVVDVRRWQCLILDQLNLKLTHMARANKGDNLKLAGDGWGHVLSSMMDRMARPVSRVLEPHVKFASRVRSERWLVHLFFSLASARNPRLLSMLKTVANLKVRGKFIARTSLGILDGTTGCQLFEGAHKKEINEGATRRCKSPSSDHHTQAGRYAQRVPQVLEFTPADDA
jgi:hypothetical protein